MTKSKQGLSVDGYRADFDGLRAVAIIGVVLFHAYPEFVPAGLLGVDIFFVLSGYLMTRLVWRLSTKEAIWRFYCQRAQRLYPPLLLFVLAMLGLGAWRLTIVEYSALGFYALSALSFTINGLLAVDRGPLSDLTALNPFLHLWSLAIEAQFYIIWPVVLMWITPAQRFNVVFVLFCLSVGSVLVLSQLGFSHWLFYMPLPRLFAMMLGALAACVVLMGAAARFQSWVRSGLGLSGTLLVGILVTGVFWLDPLTTYPNFVTLVVALATMLFILTPTAWFNRGVSWAPIGYVGRISYSWYLWHWGLFALFQSFVPVWWLILLSFSLAAVSYHAVELPLQRRRRAQVRQHLT